MCSLNSPLRSQTLASLLATSRLESSTALTHGYTREIIRARLKEAANSVHLERRYFLGATRMASFRPVLQALLAAKLPSFPSNICFMHAYANTVPCGRFFWSLHSSEDVRTNKKYFYRIRQASCTSYLERQICRCLSMYAPHSMNKNMM
jgi:hypothetical protein